MIPLVQMLLPFVHPTALLGVCLWTVWAHRRGDDLLVPVVLTVALEGCMVAGLLYGYGG